MVTIHILVEEDAKMDGSVNGQNGDVLLVGHSNGELDKEASKNDANDVLTWKQF